jgi:hypothetical protein
MGTLQHQDVRNWHSITDKDIIDYSEMVIKISTKTNLSIDQVIKIAEIKQSERRNNLYVTNGDIHDEQMSGIGALLEQIDSSLEKLADAVSNLDPSNNPNS